MNALNVLINTIPNCPHGEHTQLFGQLFVLDICSHKCLTHYLFLCRTFLTQTKWNRHCDSYKNHTTACAVIFSEELQQVLEQVFDERLQHLPVLLWKLVNQGVDFTQPEVQVVRLCSTKEERHLHPNHQHGDCGKELASQMVARVLSTEKHGQEWHEVNSFHWPTTAQYIKNVEVAVFPSLWQNTSAQRNYCQLCSEKVSISI